MRSNLTSNLLGGPLLSDILSYVQGAAQAVSSGATVRLPALRSVGRSTARRAVVPSPRPFLPLLQVYYKLLHLSSHYNTQLGVLGALGVDATPAELRR